MLCVLIITESSALAGGGKIISYVPGCFIAVISLVTGATQKREQSRRVSDQNQTLHVVKNREETNEDQLDAKLGVTQKGPGKKPNRIAQYSM